jgi:hypothetical protein
VIRHDLKRVYLRVQFGSLLLEQLFQGLGHRAAEDRRIHPLFPQGTPPYRRDTIKCPVFWNPLHNKIKALKRRC